MKPFTFGLIIFLEIMLLDGIFAASTIKQRHHISPFVMTPFYGEDYKQEDIMKITVKEIAPDTFTGADNRETQALAIIAGKTQVSQAEIEKNQLPDVQIEVRKDKP